MATERHSAKQYGVRYGRKLREKVGKLDKERKDSNVCPYCHYEGQIKRLSSGIWTCQKCKAKFTGRAYKIGKKLEGVEKREAEQMEDAPVILNADIEKEDYGNDMKPQSDIAEPIDTEITQETQEINEDKATA